ncbi:MAG: GAF domain-containing protein [Candidatus Binatia bacterium]
MSEQDNSHFGDRFRQMIETIDVANLLTEPLTNSINNLLQTSAAEIASREASVLVRDGDQGDLRFLTAIGEVAQMLYGVKVPAGKGIAGFVFSSGQPMAVADVGEESSFYAEIDKKTGYSTQTILATPLRHGGEIIGVLEYVNRPGVPPYEAFTPEEMDKAAFYGEAIASLVNAYESAKVLRELGEEVLSNDQRKDLTELRHWLQNLRDSVEHRETMELAVLLREIAGRGGTEREMCRELLAAILKFSDAKSETSFLG